MATAAIPFSFSSLALINLSLCVYLFFISFNQSAAATLVDVSSTCPHVLTTSTINQHSRPTSSNSSSPLLVVVPWKVGFEQFVQFNHQSCVIDGFSVQVFLQALHHMRPRPLDFQFVLHGNGSETPSYEAMIDMVVNGTVDAVVADLTITKERMDKVGFTMPYLPSTLVMVTPFRYGSAGTLWDFLKPFSRPLWLTLLASFVATGVALYLLENKNPDFSTTNPKKLHVVTSPEPSIHGSSSPTRPNSTPITEASTSSPAQAVDASTSTSTSVPSRPTALSTQMDNTYLPPLEPSSLQRFGPPIYDQASHKRRIMNAYWFTSLCVFAAQQESVRTHLGRIVTVMWLFVMLIFNSSYTASLASLLSAEKRYPTIEGFQALQNDKNISVGYQEGSFMKDYMKKLHIDQYRLKKFTSRSGYAKALKQGNLKPDGVGAILDELPYIQILLQSECFLTKGPDDDDLPSWGGFAFAFRQNSSIIEEMSKMIVAMQEDATIKKLQNGWGIGGTKKDRCSSSTEEPSHLRLRSFGGLFSILCGAYVFCIAWRFSFKAFQSNGERCVCINNALACAKDGCNICQGVSLSKCSSKVSDVSLEHHDASLENRDASLEHSEG